jgi:hypothetical protein
MKVRILLLVALLLLPVALSAQTFTGSLYTPGGVTGSSYWNSNSDDGFRISWNISRQNDGNWRYRYYVSDEDGYNLDCQLDRIIIEVSPTATASDFWNFRWDGNSFGSWSINNYSANSTYPNMPQAMYGMRLTAPSNRGYDFNFSFYSDRAPTWGDFYAKSDYSNGSTSTAWNEDFTMADPNAAPEDGLLTGASGGSINKILRPDTVTGSGAHDSVPEPATLLLFGLGATGVGLVRRLRNRK